MPFDGAEDVLVVNSKRTLSNGWVTFENLEVFERQKNAAYFRVRREVRATEIPCDVARRMGPIIF